MGKKNIKEAHEWLSESAKGVTTMVPCAGQCDVYGQGGDNNAAPKNLKAMIVEDRFALPGKVVFYRFR